MMCDTLISPKVDKAIRKRLSKYKKKSDSPDFRDILRQRCRERVKARRGAILNHLRNLNDEESVRNALSQFLVDDIKEIQSSQSLEDLRKNDLMEVEDQPLSSLAENEKEKWILDEYERLLSDAQAELFDQVTCPMCDHGILQADTAGGTITCSLCSLLLPLRVPLTEVEALISQAVDCHECHCSERPMFTVCPDNNSSSLLLMCTGCYYFHHVL